MHSLSASSARLLKDLKDLIEQPSHDVIFLMNSCYKLHELISVRSFGAKLRLFGLRESLRKH